MEELTVKQIEAMVEYAFRLREEYQRVKDEAENLFAKLKDHQEAIVTALESLGLTSYKAKSGAVSYKYTATFKTPKTPEDREAFFSYLKEKGLFDNMITVNSRTLNSWAKQEEEANMHVLDFQIPGLEKGAPEATITMRKA
jgi:hypothetical protein